MASTESKIMAALFARAATLAPALPIAWPNLSFTKPADGKYLRVSFIPNTADRIFIGSTDPHRFLGMLQVDVMWPLGQGQTEPLERAGAVAEHFPADLRLTSDGVAVRVRKHPDVGPLLVEDAGVMVPVTIEYEAWA